MNRTTAEKNVIEKPVPIQWLRLLVRATQTHRMMAQLHCVCVCWSCSLFWTSWSNPACMHAPVNGVMHIYLTLKLITFLATLVRRLPPTLSTCTLVQRLSAFGISIHIEFHWNLASIPKNRSRGKTLQKHGALRIANKLNWKLKISFDLGRRRWAMATVMTSQWRRQHVPRQ